jgi:hypothetical protein
MQERCEAMQFPVSTVDTYGSPVLLYYGRTLTLEFTDFLATDRKMEFTGVHGFRWSQDIGSYPHDAGVFEIFDSSWIQQVLAHSGHCDLVLRHIAIGFNNGGWSLEVICRSIDLVATDAPNVFFFRAKAQARINQDSVNYSEEELREIEDLYESASQCPEDVGSKTVLQRISRKYPQSNRAGVATLLLADLSEGSEREAHLRAAIATYSSTWFANGVPVGGLARVQLALSYARCDRMVEAKALATEVVELFPGAMDHHGVALVNLLRAATLL